MGGGGGGRLEGKFVLKGEEGESESSPQAVQKRGERGFRLLDFRVV